jgi:F-type H+-transporting ATPase subunit gamma
MSKRRELDHHVRTLDEIESIMGAMKNLALMETVKLGRLLTAQDRVVAAMEAAGQECRRWHPALVPEISGPDLFLVVGSERGFCGDFNERIWSALDRHLGRVQESQPPMILIGRKLAERATPGRRIVGTADGATVTEEVQTVLTRVVDVAIEQAALNRPGGRAPLTVVYRDGVTDDVRITPLWPFSAGEGPARSGFSPLLTLAPAVFVGQLVDLYLFALLHAVLCSALMAENRARLAHLEAARQRLEQERAQLSRKRNELRQEEITEEIEVLMLSADNQGWFR